MSEPEFPRPVRLDVLSDAPRTVTVEAELAERVALARRFVLQRLDRLTATARLTRDGDVVNVTGRIDAAVTQSCVASGEPVPAALAEEFVLRFVPEQAGDPAEEIELGEGDLDVMTYTGGAVDLGEAVAQTLALALDPFPRAPGAAQALREAGVIGEGETGPFAALKALKDRLGG